MENVPVTQHAHAKMPMAIVHVRIDASAKVQQAAERSANV
jgi:hypothetical protein